MRRRREDHLQGPLATDYPGGTARQEEAHPDDPVFHLDPATEGDEGGRDHPGCARETSTGLPSRQRSHDPERRVVHPGNEDEADLEKVIVV